MRVRSRLILQPATVDDVDDSYSFDVRLAAASTVTGTVRLARSAHTLLGIAVNVLPGRYKDRYREEFSAELLDLAAAAGAWWKQVLYAMRLLDRAWVLRAELLDVSRQKLRK